MSPEQARSAIVFGKHDWTSDIVVMQRNESVGPRALR
jgi:hypothetical protein